MPKIKTAIGLMSGTSMDGIDVALVKTDGLDVVDRGPNAFFPYTPQTRDLLQQALEDSKGMGTSADRPGCLQRAEAEITSLHVEAVAGFLSAHGLRAEEVDVLGFHGQTVLHKPDEGWTVQLGDGSQLAKKAGIATVYDMRGRDMEYGGQGAPLVPVYHQALTASIVDEFRSRSPVVFVNIGGISNVTYVGDDLFAFDAGPGNALIDQWVQRHVGISHDDGGRIAAEGSIDHALVAQYLSDPFFGKPVPKSLDRNDFAIPRDRAGSTESIARTLARVTAEALYKSADHVPEKPMLWVICGGGRRNPHILGDLKELVEDGHSLVITAEEAGFDGDAMEAEAWAYLAVRSTLGLPLTYPTTTGCREPVCGGQIAYP